MNNRDKCPPHNIGRKFGTIDGGFFEGSIFDPNYCIVNSEGDCLKHNPVEPDEPTRMQNNFERLGAVGVNSDNSVEARLRQALEHKDDIESVVVVVKKKGDDLIGVGYSQMTLGMFQTMMESAIERVTAATIASADEAPPRYKM